VTESNYPQWLVSAIVPVYNVEKYLAQTLDSITSQSIGFESNIQLILVDDGSTDDSQNICHEYADRYPSNVIYINQKNAGVSAARNRGLSEASGKYVHFLDSDDIISSDFYELAIDFHDTHEGEVDFVAPKIKFFDANIDEHPNNYKFQSTRVIDVTKDSDNPIMHVSSCFFVAEALRGKQFDTRLVIAEDAKFVADVLERKRKYGVLANGCLHYRKRGDGSSAINSQFKSKTFYTVTPKLFLEYLLDSWRDESGRPADYAQCVVLYDLRWRLEQKQQHVLSEAEELSYKKTLKDCIKQLDDRNIIKKHGISLATRMYILRVKYGESWGEKLVAKNGKYVVGDETVSLASDDDIHLDFVLTDERKLKVEGYSKLGWVESSDVISIRAGDVQCKAEWVERKQREQTFLGEKVYSGGAFEAELELPEGDQIEMEFYRKISDGSEAKLKVSTNRYARLSVLPFSYRQEPNLTVRKESGRLMFYRRRRWRSVKFEVIYLGVILLNWRMHTAKERLGRLKRYNLTFLSPKQKLFELIKPFAFSMEAVAMIPKAILLRLSYRVTKPYMDKQKPIWLVSDRPTAAGDNGEALYRYILQQNNVAAKVYFVIAKRSPDYRRMVELGGKVLDQGSLKYQFLFLFATKIISSQADIETTNPYIRQIDHYLDLFRFEFIFLQHGIIRNDLSSWLNRYEKNITLLISSAEVEYRSLLDLPYYYGKEHILLSGLPRYDLLESQPKKKLVLAPTYRKHLVRMKTDRNGYRRYDTEFKKTQYYNFYNTFINDPRVLQALKEKDMIGEFYLHPVFSGQAVDFDSSSQFEIKKFPYDYTQAFREGSILVSDYSSLMFDFAYLKKPIIYSQYDADTYFDGHTSDKADFFSDVDNGFGQVAYDYESIVEAVVAKIHQGCSMDKGYVQRVDSFFAFRDQNNCARVYEALLEHTV